MFTQVMKRSRKAVAAILAAAVMAGTAAIGVVAPAAAADAPQITVTKAPRAGGEVTVNGTGFTSSLSNFPGIYLGLGRQGLPGFYAGSSEITETIFVKFNGVAEGSAAGRVERLNPDGTFEFTVKTPEFTEGPGLAFYTSLAHGIGFGNKSLDTITAVEYAPVKPEVTAKVATATQGSLAVQLEVSKLPAGTKVYAALIEAGNIAGLQDMANAQYAAFALPFPVANEAGELTARLVAPGTKLDVAKEYEVVVWKIHSAATPENIYGVADVAISADNWEQIFPTPVELETIRATKVPTISGTAKYGSTLTAQAGTWSAPAVTEEYQWLRNGTAIPGATKATYKVALADIAQKLSVKVTASKEGFNNGEATSAAVTGAKADAAKSTSVATISGKAVFNSTLKVSPGKWNQQGVTFTYQWLRNGKAVSGATKSSYKLTAKDVSTRISVKVVAAKAGHYNAAGNTAKTATVKKATPTVSVKLSKTTIKKSASAKVTVKVKAAGVSKPTGKVVVKVGKKSFTKTVKASVSGNAVITVKGLKVGKNQKVTAKFTPSGSSKSVLNSKTSAAKKLTVR